MFKKDYSNFVRPSSQSEFKETYPKTNLTGDEAKRIYLNEIIEANFAKASTSSNHNNNPSPSALKPSRKRLEKQVKLSDRDLFLTVQHDDVDTLILALDNCPDKINVRDEYGWSLLMIACQANSVDTVKELLKRDIDTSVRDKAGNSAQSLVIKNKNIVLADLLLSYKHKKAEIVDIEHKKAKVKLKEEYVCETCGNKTFSDKEEHLSSTIHNINASKGKKIPTYYIIPQSNKGFQMMLRVGWDKDSGLGPDGSGKKYPIRTVQKKDRKGLGNEKSKKIPQEKKKQHKTNMCYDRHRSKNLEIKFRREFY